MTYSIKSLIENLLSELGKNDIQYKGKISKFLVDNNWFNIEIDLDNYSISDKDAQLLIEKITNYLLGPTGLAGIQPIFKQKFPLTYKYFQQYSEDSNLSKENIFYVQDFLAYSSVMIMKLNCWLKKQYMHLKSKKAKFLLIF